MTKEKFKKDIIKVMFEEVEKQINMDIDDMWQEYNITEGNSKMVLLNIDRSVKVIMFKDKYTLQAWYN